MKRFFLVLALVLSCMVPAALADEPAPAPVEDPGPSVEQSPPDDSVIEDPDLVPDLDEELVYDFDFPSSVTCSGADVTVNLDNRSYTSSSDLDPDDSDVTLLEDIPPTVVSVLRSLFGEYTPRTQTVTTYFDGQPIDTTTEIIPGVAGMDLEWLAGVSLFAIMLFCLMKLIGGLFS